MAHAQCSSRPVASNIAIISEACGQAILSVDRQQLRSKRLPKNACGFSPFGATHLHRSALGAAVLRSDKGAVHAPKTRPATPTTLAMALEQVSAWRKHLPPPFNKPAPVLRRRTSFSDCAASDERPQAQRQEQGGRRRRGSLHGAIEGCDRAVSWLRFLNRGRDVKRAKAIESAVQKLREYGSSTQKRSNRSYTGASTIASKSRIAQRPTFQELAVLTSECFPKLEDTAAIVTEFSESTCHVSRFTLEEILNSKILLDPPSFFAKVRWVHVDYHKLGTFWGSSVRFLQWGTDPVLFEKNPIILMQNRSDELDRLAGRPPLEDENIPGNTLRFTHRWNKLI